MTGLWKRLTRKRRMLETLVGLAMLPLTALPIYLYLDHTSDGYLMYLRGRYALLAPATPKIDPATRQAATLLASVTPEGVPVLFYRGIGRSGIVESNTGQDAQATVSLHNFAEQMRALEVAGYQPIDSDQLAGYLKSGDQSALPPKPVLISFDDGRTDAMLQADPVLRDTGMKATMFVVGASAASNSFAYIQWSKLRSYAENGRWDLQAHTYGLNHLHDAVRGVQPISAAVDLAPGQTLAGYARMLASDTAREDSALRAVGAHPDAFAYPFDDWGREAKPGVAALLRAELARDYEVAFDQSGQSGWRFTLAGDDPLHVHRLDMLNWTGPEFVQRLEAAAKLTTVVYDERGLGNHYTALELARAAAASPTGPPASSAPLRSVDTGGRKLVALTFDGGPSPFTAQVIDQLRLAHARGTFFLTGDLIAGNERLLQEMMVEGDEVGDASWDTTHSGVLGQAGLEQELARTSVAIGNALPLQPRLARPAHGEDSATFRRAAAEHGLATVLWSLDPGDNKPTATPGGIAAAVLAQVTPGAIVILNDGGNTLRWKTVQALPVILAGLKARGYEVVTVSQLAAAQAATTSSSSLNFSLVAARGAR